MARKRFLYLLALLIGSIAFIASSNVTFAHEATATSSTHINEARKASVTLAIDAPYVAHQALRPASETSNCDDPNTATYNNNGLLCAVASYATPCLKIHNVNNWNVLTCVKPGTIIALDCQVNIPSQKYLGNSYWDVGVLSNGTAGEFSDAYMDTEWTNNTGSPSLGTCGGG